MQNKAAFTQGQTAYAFKRDLFHQLTKNKSFSLPFCSDVKPTLAMSNSRYNITALDMCRCQCSCSLV